MSKLDPNMPRYGVVPGSASGHGCCFVASVVDTQDPEALALNAAPDAPPESVGAKIVCECFTEGAAHAIAAALNAAETERKLLEQRMPPELRAIIEAALREPKTPNADGGNNVH